jgi:hypothetical protein
VSHVAVELDDRVRRAVEHHAQLELHRHQLLDGSAVAVPTRVLPARTRAGDVAGDAEGADDAPSSSRNGYFEKLTHSSGGPAR